MKKKVMNKRIMDKIIKKYKILNIITIILLIISLTSNIYLIHYLKTNKITKIKTIYKVKVPENILFLGDSITYEYQLDKYYKNHNVVNSGICGDVTDDILNNLQERVYQYNPSKIFLLIGTNDVGKKKDEKTIISNIEKIIKTIKEKKPEVQIYLESIYPVNDTDEDKIDHEMVEERQNSEIKEINEQLKNYCKTNNIKYINLYNDLVNKEGNLDLKYTKDGLHISDEGYQLITEKLKEYLK